jgi:hypothetical protein
MTNLVLQLWWQLWPLRPSLLPALWPVLLQLLLALPLYPGTLPFAPLLLSLQLLRESQGVLLSLVLLPLLLLLMLLMLFGVVRGGLC